MAQGAVKQAESTQEANTEVEHLKNSLDETKEYVSGMNGMTERQMKSAPRELRV